MSILTNKHFIVALIVAPILAVIAYFSVDYMVTEKPHSAVAGNSYSLVAKSNCRYQSGVCDIENGEMKARLKALTLSDEGMVLQINSAQKVEQILVDVSEQAGEQSFKPNPGELLDQGKTWQFALNLPTDQQQIRIVMMRDGVRYFAQVPSIFLRKDILDIN